MSLSCQLRRIDEIRSFRFKEQIAEISKIRVRQIFDAAAADSNFFPKICFRKMSEFDLGLNFNLNSGFFRQQLFSKKALYANS